MQKSNIIERYPYLEQAFLFKEEKKCSPCATPLVTQGELEGIEVVFVLGLTSQVEVFKSYIKRDNTRLVFIEDNLGFIQKLIGNDELEELFSHRRVELIFMQGVEEACYSHISHRCIVLDLYQTKSALCQEFIQKQIQIRNAIDNHHGHDLLMRNFFTNLAYLKDSIHIRSLNKSLSNSPIILCGPAPSIKESKETLLELKKRAIIMAVGTGILALEKIGIEPDFILATDPNISEYKRFKGVKNRHIPIIYTTRLHYKILSLFTGKRIFLPFEDGMRIDTHFNKVLGIATHGLFPVKESFFDKSSTVTHVAIDVCHFLGAKHILFCGVDLCFRDKERYLEGSFCKEEQEKEMLAQVGLLRQKLVPATNSRGCLVETSEHFLQEKKVIEDYIEYYCQITFSNISKTGLCIKGTKSLDMTKIPICRFDVDRYFKKFTHTIKIDFNKVLHEKKQLQKSLFNCKALIAILENKALSKGKKLVYQMDLEEELSYKILLEESYIAICYDSLDRVFNLDNLRVLVEKYLTYLLE